MCVCALTRTKNKVAEISKCKLHLYTSHQVYIHRDISIVYIYRVCACETIG